MTYENYELITSKVEKIRKHESLLKELRDDVEVRITGANNRFGIMTIGTASDSEHEHAILGKHLIESIRMDCQMKIDKLREELKEL